MTAESMSAPRANSANPGTMNTMKAIRIHRRGGREVLVYEDAPIPVFEHWTYGKDPKQSPTKDEVLDDCTLYWVTNSATSAARLYWETSGQSVLLAAAQKTAEISLPVAITVFPEEVYRAPETWARRAYRNLIYFNEVNKGCHFAAWEEPELFSAELRAAFQSPR